MKRPITIASSAIVLCLVFFTASLAQTGPGPSLVLPERSFDFGEVEEGNVVEHAFKVLNKGSQSLEITNVNPG